MVARVKQSFTFRFLGGCMCGYLALFGVDSVWGSSNIYPAVLKGLDRIKNRGPDGEGVWTDSGSGVVLGHRRLAIIDLNDRSAQPMVSVCGRYCIVFNGEIYNFAKLRGDLESSGVVFKTHSDTEVILELYRSHGESMLTHLHGMFSFAIWDMQLKQAFVARDPYGIKPLYVGHSTAGILVGSQVKSILKTGLVDLREDLVGQAGFWMTGSVPEPRTWFENVKALPAGGCLTIKIGAIVSQRIWANIGSAWQAAASASQDCSMSDLQTSVTHALRESIDRHLVADVPVGVFLSGGIDSGAIAALMSERGCADLQGVTLAYEEFAGLHEDEAPVAARLASYYGIRHHVRRVGKSEFLEDLPRIMMGMDQPSIDGINTWYASKAVAELGLKVVVSGVGGDELFQGYGHFQSLEKMRLWDRRLGMIPGRRTLSKAVGAFQHARTGNGRWKFFPDWSRSIEGSWWLRRSVCSPDDLYSLMGEDKARTALQDFDVVSQVRSMVGEVASDTRLAVGQIESMTYMRNQLLRDSDWASMDHSVELRTPLVDSYLLSQVSGHLKDFHKFPHKRLLACAPVRPLPEDIITRRKTGFGIPILRWADGLLPKDAAANPTLAWARYVANNCYKEFQ